MALNELVQLAGVAALEEAEILAEQGRAFHSYDDAFTDLTDTKFKNLYRLTKEMASDLIDLLGPFMVAPTRVSALSIERRVLTSLRFFASGSYQLDIGGNVNHAVSQSSVSRSIEEVSSVLNRPDILNHYVNLPRNMEELERIRTNFYLNHNFPGVMRCVDCTHVAIYPPPINDPLFPEVMYVNRKGYHSINVQLICDTSLRIMGVCARYPGSTHDSFIWNNSNALPYMHNLHRNGRNSFYLLGDSGYGLRPWLMTPFAGALPNSPKERYNERHRSTRSLIERCNGVLKLRFRCLLKHRVLHYSPEKCSKIINACSILHNMCIDNNLPPVRLGDDDGDANLPEIGYGIYENYNVGDNPKQQNINAAGNRIDPDLVAGRLLQVKIIRNHFR